MSVDRVTENVFEFVENQKIATVTLSQKRFINRLRKLEKMYPEACQIVANNQDGSILAHIPTRWIRINPSSTPLTDAERQEYLSRFESARRRMRKTPYSAHNDSDDN